LVAGAEMEQIVDEDPELQSWLYLRMPTRSENIKEIITFLKTKDTVFQTSNVSEVEEKCELFDDSDAPQEKISISETEKPPKPDEKIDDVNYFRCNGEYWDIGYQGETASIKDLKRHQYVIRLLEKPHIPFKPKQLSRLVDGIEIQANEDYSDMDEEQLLKEEGLSLGEMEIDGLEKEDKERLEDKLEICQVS
jgi:hypothetical protein